MPVQTTKSKLLSRMGARLVQAHQEHKDDAPILGSPQVPPGIEGGVAQLEKCYIGEYKDGDNKGKPYFRASGVIKHPTEGPKGEPIFGLTTSIGPEPLCDTPKSEGRKKTFNDHYGYMIGVLKALGFDISEVDSKDPDVIEQALLDGMKALEEIKPYFKFRTWQGRMATEGKYKDVVPRITHEWNGACDWNGEGDAVEVASAGVADSSQDMSDSNPDGAEDAGQADDTGDTSTGEDVGDDLETLMAQAVENVPAAQQRLEELALEAGMTAEEVGGAVSWQEVVDFIEASRAATEEPEPAPEPLKAPPPPKAKDPEKGNVFGYRVLDAKTGKPLVDAKTKKPRKPVECEVMSSDKKTRTVVLKSLADGKTQWKGVKWSDLVPMP